MATARKKSKFVGVRVEPSQLRKLIALSVQAGEPGNISAGLRWALDQADMPKLQMEVRQANGVFNQ
jgi:hypothetical protein